MRLLCAGLWLLATVLWLPWFAVFLRLMVDLASGTPPAASDWFKSALIGPWPLYTWLQWGIVSWYPIFGLAGMGVSALSWRLYWIESGFRLTRPSWMVAAGIVLPPLSLPLLYYDARRQLAAIDAELRAEADAERDALLQRGELDPDSIEEAELHEPSQVSYRSFALVTALNFAAWGVLGVVLIPWWVALAGFLLIEFSVFVAPVLLRREDLTG